MVFLVGIVGFIGAGKNTVSSVFKRHGFREESLASPLKDACAHIFAWPRALLDGVTEKSRHWREKPDTFWSLALGTPVTPRKMLQWLGTDVFRNSLHRDIWLMSLLRRIRSQAGSVVITDVRFPNEIDAIKRLGGVVVRVKRGPDPPWFETAAKAARGSSTAAAFMQKNVNTHSSEWQWSGSVADYIINNDGNIEELKTQTRMVIYDIMKTHGIQETRTLRRRVTAKRK